MLANLVETSEPLKGRLNGEKIGQTSYVTMGARREDGPVEGDRPLAGIRRRSRPVQSAHQAARRSQGDTQRQEFGIATS